MVLNEGGIDAEIQAGAKDDDDYEKVYNFVVLTVSDDKYHTIEDFMDNAVASWGWVGSEINRKLQKWTYCYTLLDSG